MLSIEVWQLWPYLACSSALSHLRGAGARRYVCVCQVGGKVRVGKE